MKAVSDQFVLALIADLYFITRVQSVCDQLGYPVKFIEGVGQVGRENADFVRYVTENRPLLIIVDLNQRAVPWAEWVAAVKSAPETADYPLIGFGAHKDVETMQQARQAGADAVYAKSRFTKAMPEIIQKYVF